MPNGIDWERLSGEKEHPLNKMLPILQLFAKQNNLKLTYSTYHDGLEVEFSHEYKSHNLKIIVHKGIFFTLVDKALYKILHDIDLTEECEKNIYCRVSVAVHTHYGLKDLIFAFIPILRRVRKKWPRRHWLKVIGCLEFPIDLKKMSSLLDQAKQTLYNFDESWLEKIKK